LICRVHVFLFVSGSSPFHQKARRLRGGQWEWSSEGTTCSGPRTKAVR
jgi:hypothetical protein